MGWSIESNRSRDWGARAGCLLALLLAPALPGCDGGVGPADDLQIEVEGWIERNATIRVRTLRHGALLDPGLWALSVEPEDGAEVDMVARTIRPLRAGSLTVRASSGDAVVELLLTVETPPRIVFHRLHEGNRDIYTVALDGGEITPITSHSAEDRDPTSSAGWIVFTSFRDGSGSLYRVPVAGGEAERLTATAARDADAALSATQGRLAFIRTSGGSPRLYTAASDGSNAAPATPFVAGAIESSPSWSPSADRIVFVSTRLGTADLWLLPLGGTATLMAGGTAAEVEPAWSPDGAHIAFASTRDGDTELYRLNVSTGDVERLTRRPGTDGQPSYLPDGRLVFTSWVSGVPELRWTDPNSSDATFPIPTGPGEPGRPAPIR